MNREINSSVFADLLNIKPKPGTLLQRLKNDMKDHNVNMDDRQIIIIKDDTNPFQNSFDEEPSSMPMPMMYQEQEPSTSTMPMMYQEQEPSTYKENELIIQQQELIRQQQELIRHQQEQLNAYKKENNDSPHKTHKKHKKTVRFQLIPFHKKMTKKKTRIATPMPRRSNSLLKL
jgi:hypothetical protein